MKFSIVTITYNRAHIIGKSIQSVINQSYQNYEHIIVDDGSTDNTKQVVSSFNSKKIKYYKIPKTGRLSTLWNIGFSLSNGYYIAILDSDDIWNSNKLYALKNFIDRNNYIDLIFHNVKVLETNRTFLHFNKNVNQNRINLDTLLKNEFPVYSSSVIFNKNLTNESENIINEDFFDGMQDFVTRMSYNKSVYYLNEAFTQVIKHNANLTNKQTDYGYYEFINTLKFLKESNKISLKKYKLYSENIIYKLLNFYYSNGSYKKFKALTKTHLSSFSLTYRKLKIIIKLKILLFSKKKQKLC